MSVASLLAVWGAALLLGSGIWVAIAGWPRRAGESWCALGGGWILGAAACGMLVRMFGAHALAGLVPRAGSVAVLAGGALWILAWFMRGAATSALPTRLEPGLRVRERIVIALLLGLLAAHGALLFDDILMHPVLPWDAWAVWLAKAKAWVLAGRIDPSVSFETWIEHASAPERTGVAWVYPELVSWVAVWFAGGVHWVEPLVGLLWLGLGAALLALHYGQWRALGVRPLAACAGVYALGSLPLLDAHVALGGYADLWIAAVLSLGAHAWLRWACLGQRRQLGIVVIAMALLPLLKLEGAAWSILLGVACVFRLLPRRLRSRRLAIGAGVLALAVLASIVLGLPWIGVARRYLDTGRFFDLGQIGASGASLAAALWAQWNWNLLWFALPVALVWNRGHWPHAPLPRRLAAFVALPFLVLIGLFVFTTAARYAQSYSAVNRLLLQLTPLLVSLLVLVVFPSAAEDAAAQAGEPAKTAA